MNNRKTALSNQNLPLIQQNHAKYLTLVEIEDEIEQIAQGIVPSSVHSNHQRKAAQIAAHSMGITNAANKVEVNAEAEVIYLCAIKRPPIFPNTQAKLEHCENWKAQHILSTEELAALWVAEIKEMSNQTLAALSSHLRLDDFSGEVFVTLFKEGTVHQHNGKHGDLFDSGALAS